MISQSDQNNHQLNTSAKTPISNSPVQQSVNQAPIAINDPVSYTLVQGNMTTDSKLNGVGWDDVTLSGFYKGESVEVNADDEDRLGVTEGAPWAGPSGQVQYDRVEGQSEKLSIKFDKPATSGKFATTNLYENEGEGVQNHELGVWIAYLDGNPVASGTFEGTYKGEKSVFEIDTDGKAFNEIVFQATEYSNGVQGDSTNDSSDFFLAGIELSSEGAYAVNQGDVLRIPLSELLANDYDFDGDSLSITYVNGEQHGVATIVGDMVEFDLDDHFVGNTQFTYQIDDGNGGVDSAKVNVIVNPLPEPAEVTGITGSAVDEGQVLTYMVELDKVTLEESVFNYAFTPENGASIYDVDLTKVTFSHGVTVNEFGQLVVPAGVPQFEVFLPTVDDIEYESTESFRLSVDNESALGDILDNGDTAIIDLVSTGDRVDTVHYMQGHDKYLWSGSAAEIGQAPIYQLGDYEQSDGLLIDVGDAGDDVFMGAGNDYIKLGDSHARLDENAHSLANQLDAQIKIDNFMSGSDDDQLLAPAWGEDSALNTSTVSNAYIDVAHAGGGNDFVHGENGADAIFGGSGNDTLFGGEGIDGLRGGSGDDILDGGIGTDILIGGSGNDILTGGLDADIFKWVDQGSDARNDQDVIKDFELGEDKLDISELLGDVDSMQDLLDNISIEKISREDVEIVINNGADVDISITLEGVGSEFGGYNKGPQTGEAIAPLLDNLFVNLPD
ncbi:putative hemolysin-type calcium-binding region [Vibrio ichthyoenteri ATCC 700023]|uniref:Putative hemolysin-type calcium-binding region n=1 Tax=Vibrio ichthyoenteri ATCC 700023 TaxID=870968 RepID=F9S2J1_9VIBR|nr:cadherin-like domain-containing protein [Vibrio ichthyoenteri]EGU39537.1 putative hemolysin-type calcium-binding region [Vibrio ichthyoenteri ATCC 700023]